MAVQFSRFGGPEVLELVDVPPPRPGPGEIRIKVRAAGVNASDWKRRQGQMDQNLPQTLGYEAAGIVDQLGDDVATAAVGDEVFGFVGSGAAQAELAILTAWARLPEPLDFAHAAAIPSSAETAARALDQLGVTAGGTLLINGASGNVGTLATQFARARGARVIGTGSAASQELLRSLGAEPVVYGDDMPDRVRALVGDRVDWALDVAGNGILPELIALTGSHEQVLTVADVVGAQEHSVHFSRGDSGRAEYALGLAAKMSDKGTLRVLVGRTFPLAQVAEAHRVGETGEVRGKLVLLLD